MIEKAILKLTPETKKALLEKLQANWSCDCGKGCKVVDVATFVTIFDGTGQTAPGDFEHKPVIAGCPIVDAAWRDPYKEMQEHNLGINSRHFHN